MLPLLKLRREQLKRLPNGSLKVNILPHEKMSLYMATPDLFHFVVHLWGILDFLPEMYTNDDIVMTDNLFRNY